MKLAHYSDIHVTLSPVGQGLKTVLGKRAMGTLNYYVGGRKRHFDQAEARIRLLLEDIDGQQVDHALCTGDITQMSYEEEFELCQKAFGERLSQPERYTVIPGNHDRYTPEADSSNRFEKYFGQLGSPNRKYPHLKDLAEGVSLLLIDVTRSAGMLDSSGLCGPEQQQKLEKLLAGCTQKDSFTILAMHYGILRANGNPDRPGHSIRDIDSLRMTFANTNYRLDMILHGHMHQSYSVKVEGRDTICVGSATDLAHGPGYNIYTIDGAQKSYQQSRRVWSVHRGAFVDQAAN